MEHKDAAELCKSLLEAIRFLRITLHDEHVRLMAHMESESKVLAYNYTHTTFFSK